MNSKIKTNKDQNSGLVRPEQVSAGKTHIDCEERKRNLKLPTNVILGLLEEHAPDLFDQSEVVGRWIWLKFDKTPSADTRVLLSQLGFHWSGFRKCWQHPCGVESEPASYDPRSRYKSYFPALEGAD